MADDKLRIVATVEDQFTGPLSKLQKGLKGVGEETAKQGAAWKKDWEGARTEVAKFQGVLGGFTPILSAVGVGSFGAALSITGITSALKAFTGNTQGLSIMARETGVTIDKLRAFGELGERFGVSAEAMKSSIGSFATTMYDLRRRWGEAYTGLQAMNLGKLAEDLVNAPNMEAALKRAMDGLQAIPEPEVRRRVSRMLFGTEDVGRVAASIGGDIGATLDEIARKMGRTTQAQVEAAQRFERSMSDLRANMEGLKTGALTPLIEEFNRLVTYLNRPESVSFFKGELDRVGQGLKDTATEAQQLMQLWERFKGVFSDDAHAPPPAFAKKPGEGAAPSGPTEAEIRRGQLEGRQASIERQKQLLERNPDAADYQRKHDRMVEELKRVGDELQRLREQGGATVSPSSYGGTGTGGASLIQKAAWGGSGFGGAGVFGGPGGIAGGGASSDGGSRGRSFGGGSRGGGSDGGGTEGGGRQVDTPRGSGAGNPRAARVGDMMRYAMDQLRREGVPEAHLRQAAAHLVGQAKMESGLNPNTVHDGGTGYGIYGARDPKPGRGRRTDMLRWLKANGYAPNSAEGQMRYMVHEAMSGRYPRTRGILMGRGTGNVDHDTNTITGEFEAPKVINRRSGAVREALNTGPSADAPGTVTQSADADGGFFPNGAPRILKPNSMRDAPGLTADEAARRRDSAKADARRAEVLADPTDERRRGEEPFYSEEDDRRAARDLGIALRNRRRKTEEAPSKPKVGDALMDRFYGKGAVGGGPAMQMPGGSGAGGKGKLDIHLHGFPAGAQARASMDDLFKETSVSKGRSQMDMARA